MKVMICMKNPCFSHRWYNLKNLMFKITCRSEPCFHKLLLTPDHMCTATFCDKKSNIFEQIRNYNIVNENNQVKEKKENSKNEILETVVSKVTPGNEKALLLDQLKDFDCLKEDYPEEKNVMKEKILEAGDVASAAKSLKKILLKSTVDDLSDLDNETKNDLNFQKNKIKLLWKMAMVDKEEETFSDISATKNVLDKAIKFVIANEKIISVEHLLCISQLLFETYGVWTDVEKMEFIGSEEFRKLHKIFFKFISKTPSFILIYNFLPLFSRTLKLDFEDIILYEIFKKISHVTTSLHSRAKIRVLYSSRKFVGCEMIYDLRELLLLELELSFRNGASSIFSIPLKEFLDWAENSSVPEDIKIAALKKQMSCRNKDRDLDKLAQYFELFYSLSDESREKHAYLENFGFNQVKTFLLNSSRHSNHLCKIIFEYGKAVKNGQTEINRKLVDNVLNAIIRHKNVSVKAFRSLVFGVRQMKHLNHKYVDYTAEFLVDNFEFMEQNDRVLLFRILKTLADHGFPSKSEEWPFVKILLENMNFDVLASTNLYSKDAAIYHLTAYGVALATMGLFPEKLINKISKLCNQKDTIMKLPIFPLNSLLELYYLVYYLHEERDCSLLKEDVFQIVVDQKNDFLKNNLEYQKNLEKYKEIRVCLEKAIELKDSVLENYRTKKNLRVPLLMVFSDENKPYCLRAFSEKAMFLEDFKFPLNSKIVVIRLYTSNQYFEDSDGNRVWNAYERQRGKMYEKLGFLLVPVEMETIERLSDDVIGTYVYNHIKDAISNSTVDKP